MGVDDITNELENRLAFDGDLDHITLIQSSSVISRVASVILGMLSLMIVILVPIVIATEVVYICFPVIRDKTNELLTKLETRGADRRLLGLAFRDAKHAIEQVYCNGNGTTGSILWVYLKIKVKSIVFVFFLVALVLQGGGYIVQMVWSLVGNVIEKLFY